jgi:hypothetical protein
MRMLDKIRGRNGRAGARRNGAYEPVRVRMRYQMRTSRPQSLDLDLCNVDWAMDPDKRAKLRSDLGAIKERRRASEIDASSVKF